MKRVIRILLTVIVLSAVAIMAIQVIRSSRQAANEAAQTVEIVDETTLENGILTVSVSGTGTITPVRSVLLLFEASAPVVEVQVRQRVNAGEVLAWLDTTDLDVALQNAQTNLDMQQVAYNALLAPARDVDIAAAEAALTAAQAAAGAAYSSTPAEEAEIARLQAELARNQLWQAQLQRDVRNDYIGIIREFFGQEPPAVGNMDSAEYSVQIADANAASAANRGPDTAGLASANAAAVSAQVQLDRLLNGPSDTELQMADLQLQMAQLAVEQAQASVNNAVLVAPFDGVIAQDNLVVGELPPADNAAMLLIDDSSFYVDLAIDETDIVKVEEGQLVELKLDALPDATITGTVTRVALTPTQIGQLVTYLVRVTLDASNDPVRAGMSATATVIVNELDDVLVLPNRFIRIDRLTQQAYITIADENGQFSEVLVQLGLQNDTESQIVSGLEAGERVVLLPRGTYNIFSGPPGGTR